jgi:hypothetical protein
MLTDTLSTSRRELVRSTGAGVGSVLGRLLLIL